MSSIAHPAVTWTYNDEAKMGGKLVKSRCVIKQGTPTSYTFKWEMLGDDGSWKPILEGKSTKGAVERRGGNTRSRGVSGRPQGDNRPVTP